MIFLLKFGVSPNCYTRYGRTYLHYASEYYLSDIIGFDINDEKGDDFARYALVN